MRTVALSTLITRVQRRVDIESATQRFPASEITDYLNEGIAEFWERLNRTQGHDSYIRSSDPFQTASNVSAYPLPADFYRLISVDVSVGGSNFILTARPYMESERNRYKFFPVGWSYGTPVYYKLEGQTVNFIPTPPGAMTVALNYVPTSPILVNPGDTFDGIIGWEEYPVLWAAERCAVKNKLWDQANYLSGLLAKMRERIEEFSAERDDQPERVQDVTGDSYDGFGSGSSM